VLIESLEIQLDGTVADLRQRVRANHSWPPRTRTLRIFVGHGGTELDNDALPIAASALVGSVDTPLVASPVLCKSMRPAGCLVAPWRGCNTIACYCLPQ